MLEFIRRLGKKVQGLLNKIFGKKDKKPQSQDNPLRFSADVRLGPGEIFLDGMSLGKVESITSINKNDIPEESWESLKSIFGDGEINCGWVEIPSQAEIQKNFFNIPLSFLPKRYWCKTLILTLTANQESDYQAVDMSQYETHKVANYIVGRTTGWDKLIDDFLEEQEFESEEERQEEEGWLTEMRETAEADGFLSVPIGEATLLYYAELGIWDIE